MVKRLVFRVLGFRRVQAPKDSGCFGSFGLRVLPGSLCPDPPTRTYCPGRQHVGQSWPAASDMLAEGFRHCHRQPTHVWQSTHGHWQGTEAATSLTGQESCCHLQHGRAIEAIRTDSSDTTQMFKRGVE